MRLNNDKQEASKIEKVERLVEILANQNDQVLRVAFQSIMTEAVLDLDMERESDYLLESGLNSSEGPNLLSQR